MLGNPISLIDPDGRAPLDPDPVDPPKMQSLDSPSDLFSMKMVNNLGEGLKYAVSKGVDEVVDLLTIERVDGITATAEGDFAGADGTTIPDYSGDAQDVDVTALLSVNGLAGKSTQSLKRLARTDADVASAVAVIAGLANTTRVGIKAGETAMDNGGESANTHIVCPYCKDTVSLGNTNNYHTDPNSSFNSPPVQYDSIRLE